LSKINKALREIDTLSRKASEDNFCNNIHPLVKLILTITYISVTASFNKYDFYGLISLSIFPLIVFISGRLSFKETLYRLRVVIPFVVFIGLFNPILDREVFREINGFVITGGMISFVTLVIKGLLTVFASYFFIATTTIEKLCYALKIIHFPNILINQILLIYRYVTVLLTEVKRITQAYELRAPNQRGVNFKVWGSLVGNLLLNTVDRAQEVYESMCLRGFESNSLLSSTISFKLSDFLILMFGVVIIICLKIFPVLTLIGGLFV